MSKSDLVDLDMQMHAQTSKAVRVSDDGEDESAVWLPLSQIEIEDKGQGMVVITMPEWLAMDKGLI